MVREKIVAFASAHDLDRDAVSSLLTALGEAVANSIEHAVSAEPIDIEVRLEADRIVAIVCDRGVGFDTASLGGSALPEGSAERGRGIPIMRRCADAFAIDSEPGVGTTVAISVFAPHAAKRGPPARAAGAA